MIMNTPTRNLTSMIAAIVTLVCATATQLFQTAYSQEQPAAHAAQMHDHTPQSAHAVPGMAGQDAFGAIQEIVRLLEADPTTDWSKVNLEALRQHLIDMNEVTLNAEVAMMPIEGGIEIAVTGRGRTLAAIQRMVPAHARELHQMNALRAATQLLPDGVRLTVTTTNPKEVPHLRGLGFIGLLVSGAHHQPHHLAIAKGERIHEH